jgi:hypothetical protein
VARSSQPLDQGCLQLKSGVIGTQVYAHGRQSARTLAQPLMSAVDVQPVLLSR